MIALRFRSNRGEPVTAGLPGLHVTCVIANSVTRDPRYRSPDEAAGNVSAYVGGLRDSPQGVQTHVQWLDRALTVGDVITVSIVEIAESQVSTPETEKTAAEVNEEGERKRLAHLIRKYGVP